MKYVIQFATSNREIKRPRMLGQDLEVKLESRPTSLLLFFTLLFTLLFSHLADAFIQSDLQIRKSNYNYKLKLYKYYIYTHLRKLRN